MYKAIIFDFFDVIHSDPFQRWLKKHGYEREGEFAKSARQVDFGRISYDEHYRRLSELSGQSAQSIKEIFDDTRLIDQDMVELITSLQGRYKIGLLSNAGGQYLRPILEEHRLIELFDEIAISAEVGIIKPDPAIFRHILDRLGVGASETVFIDDNPGNTAGAEAAGIRSIVFTGEKALRQELEKLKIL
jgi:HAD superfamily hydrolase (TIGR01509 family)